MLAAYLEDREHAAAAPERLAYAAQALLTDPPAHAGQERRPGYWAGQTVAKVTPETCRGYARHRAALGIGMGTIARELSTLTAALNADFAAGRLTAVPPTWKPQEPPPAEAYLERHEIARLIRAARQVKQAPLLPHYIRAMLYSFGRPGAVLELTAAQVDLRRAQVDLRRPVERQADAIRPQRTAKGRGVVPLPPAGVYLFRALMRRAGPGAPLFHRIGRDGRPMQIRSMKKSFAAAVRMAGLEGRVTPKTLRHTAITLAIAGGVAPWLVAKAAGHRNSRMVEERYGHLQPDHIRGVAEHHRRPRGAVMGQS